MIRTSAGLAALLALAIAAPASAAPDRTIDLTLEQPTATWASDPTVGFTLFFDSADPAGTCDTTPLDGCEETLLSVPEAGDVAFTIPNADDLTNDWDVYVYESDAEGSYGDIVALSEGAAAERVTFAAEDAGHFLILASPYEVIGESYDASAAFTLPQEEELPVEE